MPYKDPSVAKARQRAYYLKNKERLLAQNKAWVEANIEQVKAAKKLRASKILEETREAYNAKARARYHQKKQWNADRKKAYKSQNKHLTNANASKRRESILKLQAILMTARYCTSPLRLWTKQ